MTGSSACLPHSRGALTPRSSRSGPARSPACPATPPSTKQRSCPWFPDGDQCLFVRTRPTPPRSTRPHQRLHWWPRSRRRANGEGLGLPRHRRLQHSKRRGCQAARRRLGHRLDKVHRPLAGEERYDLLFDAAANLGFAEAKHILSDDGIYMSSIPSPTNLLVAPVLNRFRRKQHRTLWVSPDGDCLAPSRRDGRGRTAATPHRKGLRARRHPSSTRTQPDGSSGRQACASDGGLRTGAKISPAGLG